jgi:Na+-driven multidrug efflux pump
VGSGIVLGLMLAAISPVIAPVFSSSPDVQRGLSLILLVMAPGVPIAGYVFVLDGVLIGAGDARYLALTGLVNLLCYAPMLVAVQLTHPEGDAGIVWLWLAFGIGYIGARAVTLGLRARGTRWLVTESA